MADEGDKKKNLGRGLSALLGEEEDAAAAPGAAQEATGLANMMPIEFLRPGPYQPRHRVDETEIKELADSIAAFGILQPILVRHRPSGEDDGAENDYEIVAGERRWRAAQLAKQHQVPVIVKDLGDGDMLEIALVENLQRENLSPLEEAEAFQRLMDEFSHTQEALAKALGKSRSHIANTVRLLALPDAVKALLDQGALSAGHGRALLNAEDPVKLAKSVVRRGLNVRQTEKLTQKKAGGRRAAVAPGAGQDADTLALEHDVSAMLGLKVEIANKGHAGAVTIHYQSLEQLDEILRRLSHGAHGDHAVDPAAVPPDGPIEDPIDDSELDAAMAEDLAAIETGDGGDAPADSPGGDSPGGAPDDIDAAIADLEAGAAIEDDDVLADPDGGFDLALSDEDLANLAAEAEDGEPAPEETAVAAPPEKTGAED